MVDSGAEKQSLLVQFAVWMGRPRAVSSLRRRGQALPLSGPAGLALPWPAASPPSPARPPVSRPGRPPPCLSAPPERQALLQAHCRSPCHPCSAVSFAPMRKWPAGLTSVAFPPPEFLRKSPAQAEVSTATSLPFSVDLARARPCLSDVRLLSVGACRLA